METSEQHTGTELVNFVYYPTGFVKQTSSGILTRCLKGTSFIHRVRVQKHVPEKRPRYNIDPA